MTARQITASLAALTLGLAVAAGCGEDDEPAQQPAEGTPSTVETGASTLGSTGTQPTVTSSRGEGY
jgi:hypothetical protein